MIIYIHGFGGSGQGIKASEFREYFKDKNQDFIAPSLSHIPSLAIQTLEEIIESYDEVQLIGSSLGGYYSIYLSNKYNLKAVLINPSIRPYITLDNYKGHAPSFYDESYFLWNDSHIEVLKKYKTKVTNQNNFFLFLQKGDELLDYNIAVDFLPNSSLVLEEGGNHSFTNISKYFDRINTFLINN